MQTRIKQWLLIAGLCAAASAGIAAQPATMSYTSTEQAFESGSRIVTLPSGPGSALVLTPCPGCAPVLMRATSTTTYYLRKQKVSLREFRAALGTLDVAMTVFRSTKSGELTRIVAELEAPKAPSRK